MGQVTLRGNRLFVEEANPGTATCRRLARTRLNQFREDPSILTVVLLPESIVKKRTQKMDSKLANSISYLERSKVLEATDYETRCTHSATGAAKKVLMHCGRTLC